MEKQTLTENARLLEDLEKRKEIAGKGGGEEKTRRQHETGHYTAQERIELLVDDGSFLEMGMLNGWDFRVKGHSATETA